MAGLPCVLTEPFVWRKQAGAYSTPACSSLECLPWLVVEVDSRKNLSPFLLNRLQFLRIKTQSFQDGGSNLHGLNRTRDCLGHEPGV